LFVELKACIKSIVLVMSCYLFVLKLQTYIVIVFVIFNSSISKIVISQIEINN